MFLGIEQVILDGFFMLEYIERKEKSSACKT